MSSSKIFSLVGLLALASEAVAHGTVTGIVADGVYYQGYSPSFQYYSTAPVVVGWSTPEDLDNGFVAPDAYATADIICHKGATNAQTSATVKAGGTVELQWTAWPESHHGPVIDYLASCDGDCTTVDKTTLEFFKIDGVGLIDDATVPGNWASDTLIANNNSWTVTIPSDIAPGNYVLRHEIIALHSAGEVDGAQNYPQCVNLEVTGSGTATPSGTLGEALYTETDPGIEINIYQSLSTYIVPGPTLYSGAISASQTGVASATSVASGVISSSTLSPTVASTTSAASSIITPVSVISPISANATSNSTASASPTFTRFLNSTAPFSGRPFPPKTFSGRPTHKPQPTASSPAVVTPVVAVPSTAVATASESVVPTPTRPATVPSSAPADPKATLPKGTTLNDLLSWISSFYNKYGKTSYTESTVARRHARDVIAKRHGLNKSE